MKYKPLFSIENYPIEVYNRARKTTLSLNRPGFVGDSIS